MTSSFKPQKMPAACVALGGPTTAPNLVIETGSKHWFVSYNSRDSADYGGPTTAIVLGQTEYCIILNGDHRDPLVEICNTIEEAPKWRTRLARALDYAREHKDQLNHYSDPLI